MKSTAGLVVLAFVASAGLAPFLKPQPKILMKTKPIILLIALQMALGSALRPASFTVSLTNTRATGNQFFRLHKL